MLDAQINIYSVDTGHFYSNHEKYLHEMNCKYRRERNYLTNRLADLKKRLSEDDNAAKECEKITALIEHKRKKAKE